MLNLKSHIGNQSNFTNTISLLLFLLPITTSLIIAQGHPHISAHKDTVEIMKEKMQMSSFFSPNLKMNRDGSGTGWQPDSNPMWMYMVTKKKTSIAIHGSVFLRYTSQDFSNQSNRGGNQFDAPNVFMFKMAHKLNQKNLLSVSTMFSFDAFTVGNDGYPLLLQTGESLNGIPLVDRQHPHDLFAELAVNYTHSITKEIDINTYFGYPGEPALGPAVFIHRLSALNNPDAPLAHHWQDATHTTFGVSTFGLRYKKIKIEASIFTGREPNENRYNFDQSKLDSYSYRLSANPDQNFSLQFSQGYIKSPEALFPDQDITRTTASVIHSKPFEEGKFISSTLVWGMNHLSDGENLNSLLFESNLQLKPITIYTRYEFVQKNAHELQLQQFSDDTLFNINAFTLGVNKFLLNNKTGNISIGAQTTINFPDQSLKDIYGKSPLGGQIYLRFSPPYHHH